MRNKPALLAFALLGLWGCLPAPELVSIDANSVALDHPGVRLDSLPGATPAVGAQSGNLPGQPADQLYEGRSRALNAEALASLQANRQKAIDRFIAELERRLLGELDLERREGGEQLRQIAEDEWQETAAALRTLFEKYSDERGLVLLELSGFVGFPDKGKPVRAKGPNDVFKDFRAKKVDDLRARLRQLDTNFDSESSALIRSYNARVVKRMNDFNESAGARVEQVKKEAARQAHAAVKSALAGLETDFPVIDRNLPALPSKSVAAPAPTIVRPTMNPAKTSDSGPNVQDWAKLFAKSHGYRLVNPGPGVRDATSEFKLWVARQQVGR